MVSDYLRILGDEKRGRIIMVLAYCPLNAQEISEVTEIEQTNLSKHLKKLIDAEIINFVKEGKFKYYFVNRDFINKYKFIKEILAEYRKECIEKKGPERVNECVCEEKIKERQKFFDNLII
ncbi:MAG: ArsR/SmtB family transcription factor [Mycoplasmatales bacterium]